MQNAAEEGLTEMTVDVQNADTAVQAENAASGTETDVSTETAGSEQTEEEELGRTALVADVNDYLYVRASADADAEIVGKLYKGDVAEIQEEGSGWTHVASGNVDGYVNNDYCVTGTEALATHSRILIQRQRFLPMDFVSEAKRMRMLPLSQQFPRELP